MADGAAVAPVLTLDSCVVATRDLLASDLAGEMVLLNLADGVYYGLDQVGAHIWRLVAEPHFIRELADDVVAHYEVDRTRSEHDVIVFLTDLRAHNLVTLVADRGA